MPTYTQSISDTKKLTAVPFLRWAGSKRKLLPKLKNYWNGTFKRYVEPFMGSACLFFALDPQPPAALLSDLNEELVDTFIAVRDNPLLVWKHLQSHVCSREYYYELRSVNSASLSPVKAAARFIYLNRFCFNGLYRTNRQGKFNVPYAASGTGSLPSKEALLAASEALQKAELIAGDFSKTMSLVEEGDFVYLDPPFVVDARRVFTEYYPGHFSGIDLERFSETLRELDAKGAFFMVSYADCKEGRKMLAPWRTNRVRTRRNIAGFSKNRRYAYELMATNFDPALFSSSSYEK